jgi:arsenate reductase-like glutaredoxin family protein
MADNTIKINCTTPETYRKLVGFLKDNNIVHHTYQLKEERAYRVVIKYLQHSVNTKEIENQLTQMGHKVRNVINGRHRVTKQPLNLFFVDLEPAGNNKEIYTINWLQNKAVAIEPPRRSKGILQCHRCQQYGHTKSYCNQPFVCVMCGGSHATASRKKPNNTPATCALCDGPHPANYKG